MRSLRSVTILKRAALEVMNLSILFPEEVSLQLKAIESMRCTSRRQMISGTNLQQGEKPRLM
jgi:hypothetical protein